MTIADLFRPRLDSLRRFVTCRLCGRPSLTDDGPSACRACIYRVGDRLRRPDLWTVTEMLEFVHGHEDVVRFVVDKGVAKWDWNPAWPSDNSTLVS